MFESFPDWKFNKLMTKRFKPFQWGLHGFCTTAHWSLDPGSSACWCPRQSSEEDFSYSYAPKGSTTFSHISHIHIYAPKRKFCVTLLSVFWISSCSNSLRSQFYKQTQRKRQQIQNTGKEGNISGWQLKLTFGRLSSFYRDLPCRLHF